MYFFPLNTTPHDNPNNPLFYLFLLVFPEPFRLLSLFSLALLSSALTLDFLPKYFNLNPNYLLLQPQSTSLHPPFYHASLSLFLFILIAILINLFFIHLNLLHPPLSQLISSLPAFFLLFITFRLAPFSNPFRFAHRRFRTLLKRIFLFSIPPQSLTPFSDILLADILTSLARPLAHLGLFLSSLLYLNDDLQSTLSLALNCLPYLLRLKQCINDAIIGPEKTKSFMNGVKYTTAIPMIILSSTVKNSITRTKRLDLNDEQDQQINSQLNAWILASLINSTYSTWWDIVYDWGFKSFLHIDILDRFSSVFKKNQSKSDVIPLNRQYHHHHHHHHHLSPNQGSRILFNQQTWWAYLIIIIINVTIRTSWIVDVLMGPDKIGVKSEYIKEVLEVIRRWIWCLVRIEWAEINRRKDNNFYINLNTSTHPLYSSIHDDIDDYETNLFHKSHHNQDLDHKDNEEEEEEDDETLSDGPILDLHHHVSTITLADHGLHIKPSFSSPSIQNHLEFNQDFNLLQSNL